MEGDEKRGGGDCVREYGISVAEYRSEAYTMSIIFRAICLLFKMYLSFMVGNAFRNGII